MVDRSNQSANEYQFDWQNPNLKKFDFGRMMSRAFNGALYFGQNFWLPLILIIGVPFFLIGLWPMFIADGAYSDLIIDGDLEGFSGIFTPINTALLILGGLAFVVIMVVFYIAMSHNIFGYYNGAPPSFQESMARGKKRFWVTLGASILFMLGAIIGLVLLIIPGFILIFGWYIMTPVIAVEDKGAVSSLSRAWELSKGSKRWVLLFYIILIVISMISGVVFTLIALPFGNSTTALLEGASTTYWIVSALGGAVNQIVVTLLTVAGLTSIYYEVRDMKEGINQEKLSAIFD
ncbi:MAG: hypothetical protein ABJG88_09780 [Litorimonas sp.]